MVTTTSFPNGLTTTRAYEGIRNLVAYVENKVGVTDISKYTYTNEPHCGFFYGTMSLGRRTDTVMIRLRSKATAAQAGTATSYTANQYSTCSSGGGTPSLPRHTQVSAFTPQPSYDANGNVSEYLDATGASVAHYEYSPFGRTTVATGSHSDIFKHRFSTKYLDEHGLYYYGLRSYTPVLGRWINRDPKQEGGGLNLFGFVGNDSLNSFDLYGLDSASFKDGKAYWLVAGEGGGVSKKYEIGTVKGEYVQLSATFGGYTKHCTTIVEFASTFNEHFGFVDTVEEGPRKAIIALWLKWGFVPPFFKSLDDAGIWGSWLARGKSFKDNNGWEWAAWIKKNGTKYALTKPVTSRSRRVVHLDREDSYSNYKDVVGWVHNHSEGGENLSGGVGDTGYTERKKKWTIWKDPYDHSKGKSETYIHVAYAVSPKGYVYKYDADWYDGMTEGKKIWP
ncbi:MAG: RHS repeat-associated core domain-containing protein [Lentisphaeria bacterium]|nr:RHS repeat-associated core domain-containing protein [Lentisphaeria bacterium]